MVFAAMVTEVDEFRIYYSRTGDSKFFAKRKGMSPTKKYEIFMPQDAESVKQAMAAVWESKVYQEQHC